MLGVKEKEKSAERKNEREKAKISLLVISEANFVKNYMVGCLVCNQIMAMKSSWDYSKGTDYTSQRNTKII